MLAVACMDPRTSTGGRHAWQGATSGVHHHDGGGEDAGELHFSELGGSFLELSLFRLLSSLWPRLLLPSAAA